MKTYSQFCPVSKAAEVFAERWTPLILRELLCGARRFSEIQAGVPLMSRTMLVQRLTELEEAGVIESRRAGRGSDYMLTPAGKDFRNVIEALSVWGQHWGQGRLNPKDIEAEQFMWAMRQHVDRSQLLGKRLVLRFEFSGLPASRVSRQTWWLVIGPDDVDVCIKNPGYAVDVVVVADLQTYARVWLGYLGLSDAGAKIRFEGAAADVARAIDLLQLRSTAQQRNFVYAPAVVSAP